MVMDNYYGTNAVELTKASGPLSAHLRRGRATANYCSLVDTRWWLLMYSCTADIAYRTARPIFTKRGPVPFIRDLANHDNDTPRSLATCTGCSRGSSSLVFAGAPMAHLLSCLEMDRRCVWVFRKKSAVLRQIPYRLRGSGVRPHGLAWNRRTGGVQDSVKTWTSKPTRDRNLPTTPPWQRRLRRFCGRRSSPIRRPSGSSRFSSGRKTRNPFARNWKTAASSRPRRSKTRSRIWPAAG